MDGWLDRSTVSINRRNQPYQSINESKSESMNESTNQCIGQSNTCEVSIFFLFLFSSIVLFFERLGVRREAEGFFDGGIFRRMCGVRKDSVESGRRTHKPITTTNTDGPSSPLLNSGPVQ